MVGVVQNKEFYKWKGNNEYMKQYLEHNYNFCQVCQLKITLTNKNKHLKTTKHKKNSEKSLIDPENQIIKLKSEQVY